MANEQERGRTTHWRRLIPMLGLAVSAYVLGLWFYSRQQWVFAGVCFSVGALHTYLVYRTKVTVRD